MPHDLDHWLAPFGLDDFIRREVAGVLSCLPDRIRDDFLADPGFRVYDYEPGPGVVMHVPVGPPRRGANGGSRAGRSVVLKRTLRRRPPAFVRWVIAHEFAHAHLGLGGRFPGEDPEHAADALAAEWGFPKP